MKETLMEKFTNKEIKKIRTVAKKIIDLEKEMRKITYPEARKKFVKIMAEAGICVGEYDESGIGRICNNPEWTLFNVLFHDSWKSATFWADLSEKWIPKKMLAYPNPNFGCI